MTWPAAHAVPVVSRGEHGLGEVHTIVVLSRAVARTTNPSLSSPKRHSVCASEPKLLNPSPVTMTTVPPCAGPPRGVMLCR